MQVSFAWLSLQRRAPLFEMHVSFSGNETDPFLKCLPKLRSSSQFGARGI